MAEVLQKSHDFCVHWCVYNCTHMCPSYKVDFTIHQVVTERELTGSHSLCVCFSQCNLDQSLMWQQHLSSQMEQKEN